MGRVDVDVMLSEMTSTQLSEWQAYERATGPLDDAWMQEAVASIHEQIQTLNRLTGAQFVSKEQKTNPAPKEQRYPRLWDDPNAKPVRRDVDENPTFGSKAELEAESEADDDEE